MDGGWLAVHVGWLVMDVADWGWMGAGWWWMGLFDGGSGLASCGRDCLAVDGGWFAIDDAG